MWRERRGSYGTTVQKRGGCCSPYTSLARSAWYRPALLAAQRLPAATGAPDETPVLASASELAGVAP
eukprot:6408106-Prymnesium_polylepis.1